ncbi:hypothetical protein [uncultured Draconibacterium sp.]|uniref:hypothetical protein n=1 Tax=uncultured Draconibacterium sp. TaxID=1573823 RepID=UPI0032610C36
MIQLDSNNVSALIGVLGTLAGVLLGSMLNRLARIGNIKTFQNATLPRESFRVAMLILQQLTPIKLNRFKFVN